MKKIVITLLFGAFFMSCDNILPLPTKRGTNIFGCKVDGLTLKATNEILRDNPISARMTNSSFNVGATDYNDKLGMSIDVADIKKTGTYKLDNLNVGFFINNNYPAKYYQTTQKYVGKLNVSRFDTKNKIIAGTFEFEAVNRKDTTDIIKVIRGCFDVDLNNLK